MTEKKKTFLDGAFDGSMKPMMILPVGTMKQADIKRLCHNGVCVVEAKDPAAVRFVDPLPVVSSRTKIEATAIAFSRKILNDGFWKSDETRKNMATEFIDLLVTGTPLDPQPSQAEREALAYDEARIDEMRKLAREDARKERDTQREAALAKDAGIQPAADALGKGAK